MNYHCIEELKTSLASTIINRKESCPDLRQPITGLDVIQETLDISIRCVDEVGQVYAVVTYDLNAAKPALLIQETEKPKYKRVFIMPGVFHLQMSFFKALGKVVDYSGGPEILTETDVLAPGSLKGFISGKNFNRCKPYTSIIFRRFTLPKVFGFISPVISYKNGLERT